MLASGFLGQPYEIAEQGMRAVGAGGEFRMELYAQHPGMVPELAYLHQSAVGGEAAGKQAGLLQWLTEIVIEFVAMAVALMDDGLIVGVLGSSARH
jgi:hypothetical protein